MRRDPVVETAPTPVAKEEWAVLPRANVDWRELASVVLLVVVDWAAVLACVAGAWWFRESVLRPYFPALTRLHPLPTYLRNLCYLSPWILCFAQVGLYRRRLSFWEDARQVVWACTLGALFASMLSFAMRPTQQVSRLALAELWALTLFVVPVVRYRFKRVLARVGLWQRRVLILGAGETGSNALTRLRANPETGYRPVAFVDDDPKKIGTVSYGVPIVGPLTRTPELVRDQGVSELLIAMPRLPHAKLQQLVARCEGHVHSIRIVPDVAAVAGASVEAEELDGLLLLHTRWNLIKPWNILLKRAFDVCFSLIVAIVALPLFALIALVIRLDSEGPAFFVQERIGRGGRPFPLLKFRTMFVDGEERLRVFLASRGEAHRDWELYFKLRGDDPRVTRVGRILRRLSLDELPQVFNVLASHMSWVGPRPYLARELWRMGELAQTIVKASPGVTGLWQTSGRSDLPFEQRLKLDEYYVRNWSLWMDITVMLKTVTALLNRRGAY